VSHIASVIIRIIVGQFLAIPFTFAALIALIPALRRLEPAFGIEMIGHSGPADWVIFVVWAVISFLITATLLVNRNSKGKTVDD
jgi:hypothetical protein